MDWFNNRRLLAPISNIPPAEAEERYYAMLDDTHMTSQLKPNGLQPSRSGLACSLSTRITLPENSHFKPEENRAEVELAFPIIAPYPESSRQGI